MNTGNENVVNSAGAAPTAPSKRIVSLDAMRGIAIMGVLVANIQIFAMIKVAEFNPTAFGDMTGINYVVAMLTNILVCRKFMTIFTMLFGAGIVLMSERMEAKGLKPAKKHYPRMFWLFVIGSLNFYLFSPGEILSYYAVSGLFVFLVRKFSARKLLIYGLIFLCVPTILDMTFQFRSRSPQGLEFQRLGWQPDQERIDAETARYRGDWFDQVVYKVKTRRWFISPSFYYWSIWGFLGRILLGMALFKWGFLTAAAGWKRYRKWLIFGLGAGLAICIGGWIFNSAIHWNFFYSQLTGGQFNEWGGIALAVGYISAGMMVFKAGKLKRLTGVLAALGRMALTNFIMHFLLLSLIFHGHGLNLNGKVERWGQVLIIFAIWAFQFWYSTWWLKRFRFGPVEWLWRSLTYWKRQPMRIPRGAAHPPS